jgi:hypothetical protein
LRFPNILGISLFYEIMSSQYIVNIMLKSKFIKCVLILGLSLSQHAYSVDSTVVQLKCKGRLTGDYKGGLNGEENRDERVSFGVIIQEGSKQLTTDLSALTKPASAIKCNFSNPKTISCDYLRDTKQIFGKPLLKELAGTDHDFTGHSVRRVAINIDRVTGVMSYSGDSTWIQTEPKQISIKNTERGTFECEKGLANKF